MKLVTWSLILGATDGQATFHEPQSKIFKRLRKISKSDCYLPHVCLSACPHGKTRLSLGGVFVKFDIS
jgi:hypothetical protein